MIFFFNGTTPLFVSSPLCPRPLSRPPAGAALAIPSQSCDPDYECQFTYTDSKYNQWTFDLSGLCSSTDYTVGWGLVQSGACSPSCMRPFSSPPPPPVSNPLAFHACVVACVVVARAATRCGDGSHATTKEQRVDLAHPAELKLGLVLHPTSLDTLLLLAAHGHPGPHVQLQHLRHVPLPLPAHVEGDVLHRRGCAGAVGAGSNPPRARKLSVAPATLSP